MIGFNVILYFNMQHTLLVVSVIFSAIMSLIIVGNNYRISDGKLSKHFFNINNLEIEINEIKTVEFYSERKAGYIRINIASPDEDEYRLLFENGEVLKIPSYYMSNRMTVGEFLCKQYKIKKKVTKKIKYIYGNP